MEGKTDYISQLPQDVIHQIYSFLPPKEIAVTLVLSRTWNRMFSSYEHLHFVFEFNRYYSPKHHRRSRREFMSMVERYIDKKLSNLPPEHCQPKSFSLSLSLPTRKSLREHLDGVIAIAIGRRIPELSFHPDIRNGRSYCTLPIFEMDFQTTLSLSKFKLRGTDIGVLTNLQSITLSNCCFTAQAFHNLLVGCKGLKVLKLSDCDGLPDDFSLSNLPVLRTFNFCHRMPIRSFNLDLPNLQVCSITFSRFRGEWPGSLFLSKFKDLKELTLSGANFTRDIHLELPKIEHVKWVHCRVSGRLDFSSGTLKKLILKKVNLGGYAIDTPNLESFECSRCSELFVPLTASTNLKYRITFPLEEKSALERSANKSVACIFQWRDFISQLIGEENDMRIVIKFQSEDKLGHLSLDRRMVNDSTLDSIFNDGRYRFCSVSVHMKISLKRLSHLVEIKKRLTNCFG